MNSSEVQLQEQKKMAGELPIAIAVPVMPYFAEMVCLISVRLISTYRLIVHHSRSLLSLLHGARIWRLKSGASSRLPIFLPSGNTSSGSPKNVALARAASSKKIRTRYMQAPRWIPVPRCVVPRRTCCFQHLAYSDPWI
jgi:hypothetical protein